MPIWICCEAGADVEQGMKVSPCGDWLSIPVLALGWWVAVAVTELFVSEEKCSRG